MSNVLVGKVIKAVFVEERGGAIRFDLEDGTSIVAQADGDCCSHTWIDSVQGVDQIIGSPIVSVEDVGGISDTIEGEYEGVSYDCYGGNLSWPGDSFCGGVYGQNGKIEGWRELT